MVVPFRDLDAASVRATGGCVGRLETALVDAQHWAVRWLVVRLDCGNAADRMTCIPVDVAERWDPTEAVIDVRCTVDEVRRAPSWTPETPISREREVLLRQWYGAPPAPAMVGVVESGLDPCLRGVDDMIGSAVSTPDGREGRVVDVCIDTGSWAVGPLEIDPSPWWPGDHVLVAPEQIDQRQLVPPA
jgi:hypothetical protein